MRATRHVAYVPRHARVLRALGLLRWPVCVGMLRLPWGEVPMVLPMFTVN